MYDDIYDALDELKAESERSYCQSTRDAYSKPEVLGADAKLASGRFGRAELEAHKLNARQDERSRALMHAVNVIHAIVGPRPNSYAATQQILADAVREAVTA
jgi:hypothetical protein